MDLAEAPIVSHNKVSECSGITNNDRLTLSPRCVNRRHTAASASVSDKIAAYPHRTISRIASSASDFSLIEGQTQVLGQAFNFALPQIIGALGQIPLPSLEAQGLSLAPNEIKLIGTQQQNLGLFGSLVVTP